MRGSYIYIHVYSYYYYCYYYFYCYCYSEIEPVLAVSCEIGTGTAAESKLSYVEEDNGFMVAETPGKAVSVSRTAFTALTEAATMHTNSCLFYNLLIPSLLL